MSSGWGRHLLREAARCSLREFHSHQTPGRATSSPNTFVAPSYVRHPGSPLRDPSRCQPQPTRCGPNHRLPGSDLTPALWRHRCSGGVMMRTQTGRTELGQTEEKIEGEFIFEFCDGGWWKHWSVKWTWASVPGIPSSTPPVLLLQSKNFSLNRIVSSCSETHPSSAQLGRPSPLLKTQLKPDINQQLYRKPTRRKHFNISWTSTDSVQPCDVYYAIKLPLMCFFLLSIANICKPT